MRRVWMCRALTCAVAVALVVGGCGSSGGDGTQPATQGTTFDRSGRFDTLPHYPRSDVAGSRTEKGGAIVQSYVTRGATPDDVLNWYARTLPARGWQKVSVAPAGSSTWRGDFTKGDNKLQVSAGPAPTEGDQPGGDQSRDQVRTQYSLILRPAT